MSLGVKVHRYQSWYGERCPYTKPAMKIKEEREFIPSISKPIVPPQSHQEIILGPKRERPHSAVRPSHSSSKPSVMPVRPTSGLRSRQSSGPERHQRHQDRDLKKNLSEGKILKIRSPLCPPLCHCLTLSQSSFGENGTDCQRKQDPRHPRSLSCSFQTSRSEFCSRY